MHAYPNPASSILTLEGKNIPVGSLSVRLFNSNGAEVHTSILSTKEGILKENLNISTYAEEIYTLYTRIELYH